MISPAVATRLFRFLYEAIQNFRKDIAQERPRTSIQKSGHSCKRSVFVLTVGPKAFDMPPTFFMDETAGENFGLPIDSEKNHRWYQ